MFAKDGAELIKICNENNWSLVDFAVNYEISNNKSTREDVIENMQKVLDVMKYDVTVGVDKEIICLSGLTGGNAYKVGKYLQKGDTLCGDTIVTAIARAISCSELNATMGKIVACPTAGSCGILPAVITTVGDKLNLTDKQMVEGLLAASAVGMIIGQNATFAGAEGGCQAECGAAAAMASAATVFLMGGTIEMSLDAAAIVIKNILGLVCDPVAGVVEIPCVKRNFAGAVSALSTADLVMAGVVSYIPFDEVVETMFKVGKSLPESLRETAQGGLAITKTGLAFKEKVFGNKDNK